ncbi:MAG: hypothetical protein HOV71_03920 [Hamadaea sp.]|nr:hypothetical protein [Hamadaea sp.]NUR47262.1 hypothetical protein [Hamadaea sp.]NUT03919.1 hypothetical protein [Hamadaea sp.]
MHVFPLDVVGETLAVGEVLADGDVLAEGEAVAEAVVVVDGADVAPPSWAISRRRRLNPLH